MLCVHDCKSEGQHVGRQTGRTGWERQGNCTETSSVTYIWTPTSHMHVSCLSLHRCVTVGGLDGGAIPAYCECHQGLSSIVLL